MNLLSLCLRLTIRMFSPTAPEVYQIPSSTDPLHRSQAAHLHKSERREITYSLQPSNASIRTTLSTPGEVYDHTFNEIRTDAKEAATLRRCTSCACRMEDSNSEEDCQ
jgi:hypothetical protein